MHRKETNLRIRQETENDVAAVYQLVKTAFATAQHSDGTEQDLVAALHTSGAFVPDLSLVAEMDGRLAGYILFTEAQVGADTVLALAPLAVLPKFQRQGVGAALVAEGHQIAANLDYTHSLVLGSETYYPRFGYRPAAQSGITVPEGFPSENFMVAALRPGVKPLHGAAAYAKEFGI